MITYGDIRIKKNTGNKKKVKDHHFPVKHNYFFLLWNLSRSNSVHILCLKKKNSFLFVSPNWITITKFTECNYVSFEFSQLSFWKQISKGSPSFYLKYHFCLKIYCRYFLCIQKNKVFTFQFYSFLPNIFKSFQKHYDQDVVSHCNHFWKNEFEL